MLIHPAHGATGEDTGVTLRAVLTSRAREWRGAVALAVVLSLVLLTPLTFLEPPDPLWIGGVWDDDDSDAVVVLVKSTEVSCDSDQSVVVPFASYLYAAPMARAWRPIALPVHRPENRAPLTA